MGRRRAQCAVTVKGQDVSSRWRPRVLSIEIVDKEGGSSDTAEVKLADKGGQIVLPETGDDISISLGWSDSGLGVVFKGKIDEVRSEGGKGQGRVLVISAKGFDTKGKAKQPQHDYEDDKSFGDVAKKWGGEAGIEIKIHADLESIKRPYWSIDGESFIHWGQRIAEEIGADFKVGGNFGVFTPIGEGKTASGQDLPSIDAEWGVNLLNWSITPTAGRGRFKEVRTRYYDEKEARFKYKDVQVDDNGAQSGLTVRHPAASADDAQTKSKSEKKKSEKEGGNGSFTIVGAPHARAGAPANVRGARPGIDGGYKASGVTHSYDRKGYRTKVEVKKPTGGAGKDSRSKKSSGAAASSSGGGSVGNAPMQI